MKIWILNHYATDMYFDGGGRHHAFAKYLIRMGHDVKIFCANTVHNSDIVVDTAGNLYIEKIGEDEVPYVFVKARPYKGNGKSRILNMCDYYRNIKKVLNDYEKKEGLPSIVLASSVHPLALVAGIKWAHKNKIKCVCEIRDLWPESIVSYGIASKNNLAILFLRQLEKWIYIKADFIIFTMGGGYDYIRDQGWEKRIPQSKVTQINNGIDLELYISNKEKYIINDVDLERNDTYKIIYTGSLRQANEQIYALLDAIKLMQGEEDCEFQFLIYGKGDIEEKLKEICSENDYKNVKIKGFVEKKYIPYILSKCDLNILNCVSHKILRYGGSQNKLFDYLASGNPTISGEENDYSLIHKYNCGIAKDFKSAEELVNAIRYLKKNQIPKEKIYKVGQKYDYKNLSIELAKILEQVREE